MFQRNIIVLGDRTTHGGTVISAWGQDGSVPMVINGKPVVCVGDKVTCPKCRGMHTIIEGAENPPMYLNGRQVALEGCRVSDGSQLLSAGQDIATHGSDSEETGQHPELAPDGGSGKKPLDYDLTELREFSPTLDKDMKKLKTEGWKIRDCRNSDGVYCPRTIRDKEVPVIIMRRTDPEMALVHEIGHARSPYTEGHIMQRESDAILYNAKIRQEILDNEGPDIGIHAGKAKEYAKIYEQHAKGKINYAKAQEQVSLIFCANETHGGIPYKDIGIYADSCKKILGK